MKLVSWNVNGIRACARKGFLDFFRDAGADVFCIQETKLQEGQISLEMEGYHQYWNYAEKKGYSGTAVFTRQKPISVKYGIGSAEHDHEGRAITVEFDQFYLINVYTPNSQRDLARLGYRLSWEDKLRDYMLELEKEKPVVLTGDLNVAHHDHDLKNPKSNRGNSGFTDEERGKMTQLLNSGFVDSFRYLYPDAKDVYTWWSYMSKVRERNIGWRIDYFIVSEKLAPAIHQAGAECLIMGSDHCPVTLELNV
ncbi:exodeoxyribonuclease III [Mesobacillus sp. AQ2]|uniref:exodeoxyribonuclease III n=1 Tax=Bacillaceae TaxID=186817 RepID=UPI00119D798F|nr:MULTISPECIES: exodeoxyribonuclease III [Bacillaceae]MCM3121916.1 exodeoxyribonuclease III [Mesobacillus sp. MER 33]MCM3231880.1 exodeoxyribonuclease III [Mesobacillus sp. MER 48]WHX38844.1 exodeoxyribonuclease III [Mesobacillus sp. AQ2]